MKTKLIALMITAAAMVSTGANAQNHDQNVLGETVVNAQNQFHRTFMNFGGDCYAQTPSVVQRCLVESTRGGGGTR